MSGLEIRLDSSFIRSARWFPVEWARSSRGCGYWLGCRCCFLCFILIRRRITQIVGLQNADTSWLGFGPVREPEFFVALGCPGCRYPGDPKTANENIFASECAWGLCNFAHQGTIHNSAIYFSLLPCAKQFFYRARNSTRSTLRRLFVYQVRQSNARVRKSFQSERL